MAQADGIPVQSNNFPPVRACIFDMDGLLIDSEDAYTRVTNTILRENSRPDLPWSIKAQLQGRPGPAAGKIFHQWAKLPISRDDFLKRQAELQAEEFRHCKPLPGVESLLGKLKSAHTKSSTTGGLSPGGRGGRKVHVALATSSHRRNYEIKTAGMTELFATFPQRHIIVGDDPRIPRGRGKPLPDIYLLALQSVNETVAAEGEGERPIAPEECLVFEDSVPGVEAARRAGMRVVWVPHPGLLDVYAGREEDVLAGRTGEHKEDDLDHTEGIPLAGSPGQPGEIMDGWGELLPTLEVFDYEKYGIEVSDARYVSENGQSAVDGTTDKELEEMTALADGKRHAAEEPASMYLPKMSL
ncbi:putative hydrolase [Cladophialophora carrionii]|uniref:Putative hydrolase n=1 Tax=Cladophialophora carrionii TaxID=86049 RepID=A0A1C1C7B6_9EURO|nr:putative hydrolase [Cladophialophora carrionii]